MLLPPAHPCAPVEPVRCLLEAGVLSAVAECCEDCGCDEEVFGADAERDGLWCAGGGHGCTSVTWFSSRLSFAFHVRFAIRSARHRLRNSSGPKAPS